ncbi:hypothetical protein [Kitasatospora sp. NPDC097691]|uniref:hypothetical protein n=1 Tax=Kitasatospora sp. NPDC097691 TaxID=3157231 RepID=UPI003324BE76
MRATREDTRPVEGFLQLLLYPLIKLFDAVQSGMRGHWPTERRMRALAFSPRARAARAAERERIQGLVDALGAVEGVEHLLTQVSDHCVRPSALGLFRTTSDGRALMVCRMYARAYFVIREDITAVLPRIAAADVAEWSPSAQRPSAGGTVEHALRWYREGGRTPEGWAMDSPELFSRGARLHWERPGVSIHDPVRPFSVVDDPCHVLERTPPDADPAQLLREARAEGKGVVLELVLGADGRDHATYHVVPRGGFAGRGRR